MKENFQENPAKISKAQKILDNFEPKKNLEKILAKFLCSKKYCTGKFFDKVLELEEILKKFRGNL